MNPGSILLLGKTGQVGWELCRALAPLGDVLALGRDEADLTNLNGLARLVADTKPALVVNAAAYTAVDRAESEPELAHQINALAPGALAESVRKVGAWMIHFSTDYVFDGRKRTPYLETDPPSPLGVYGRSKLEGERAVQAAGGQHLIFRLCWVYGLRGHNFLLTMQRIARERAILKVVSDQFGAPTWSRTIAEAVAAIAESILKGSVGKEQSGMYHLACAGQTSWHGFASRIVELMPPAERKAREVVAIPTSDFPAPARRPAWSVLDCGRLLSTFGVQLPDWEETLSRALKSS